MTEFKNGYPVGEDIDIPDGWYYTREEFAEMVDVPAATVSQWIHRDMLPCVYFYGRVYIPKDATINFRWPWKRPMYL